MSTPQIPFTHYIFDDERIYPRSIELRDGFVWRNSVAGNAAAPGGGGWRRAWI